MSRSWKERDIEVVWWSREIGEALALLGLSFVLSAIIGFERQVQFKSAGIRTHTLVGVGAAVFTIVSGHGFVGLGMSDPSRIAAQIVSGVGFLGAGLIFVRRNTVSGLTTAASVWVVAAIGVAAGAGLPSVAIAATVLELIAVTLLARLAELAPSSRRTFELLVFYQDGRGALREILGLATDLGYSVEMLGTHKLRAERDIPEIEAHIRFRHGRARLAELVDQLHTLPGVSSVSSLDEA